MPKYLTKYTLSLGDSKMTVPTGSVIEITGRKVKIGGVPIENNNDVRLIVDSLSKNKNVMVEYDAALEKKLSKDHRDRLSAGAFRKENEKDGFKPATMLSDEQEDDLMIPLPKIKNEMEAEERKRKARIQDDVNMKKLLVDNTLTGDAAQMAAEKMYRNKKYEIINEEDGIPAGGISEGGMIPLPGIARGMKIGAAIKESQQNGYVVNTPVENISGGYEADDTLQPNGVTPPPPRIAKPRDEKAIAASLMAKVKKKTPTTPPVASKEVEVNTSENKPTRRPGRPARRVPVKA